MNKVYVLNGPGEGSSFEIEKDVTFIGRTTENDIQIPHNSVSRRHARIIRQEDRLYLEDLTSQNGTRVNGQSVAPGDKVEITEGCFISIADALLSLGEPYSEDGMVTRYSISIAEEARQGKLIHRDRRLTNRRTLETIYEVSTTLMESLDIEEICKRVMESLFSTLPRMDSGAILLADRHEASGYREVTSRTRDRNIVNKGNYSHTIVSRVIHEGKAVIMSDTSLEPESRLSESIKMMRTKSIMCVPLMAQSRILGAVYLHSTAVPHGFRKEDLFLLTALSTPAALSIENALLFAQRREAEDALREAYKDLEHKIEIRTQDLLKANELLLQEVKERRHAEEELKETNRFLKSILDSSSSISIVSTDAEQDILFWNKGAENLFGYSQEEVVGGKRMNFLYPDEETVRQVDQLRALVLKEKREVKAEIKEKTKDGRILWLRVNLTPRLDQRGEVVGILGIGENITEKKALERDFIQAQKMEAIGTLAGGIAHDFNNLLMGIKGRTALMLLDMNPSHPHFESVNVIEECVGSAANLTRQLLSFARRRTYEVKVVDIHETIKGTLEIFGRTRKEIKIVGEYQEGVWPVEVDQNQMQQVLLNLYVNAWQAMPNGGTLSVKTENVTVYEDGVQALKGKVGRFVKISVTDTGVGMDESIQERVFEPFFTTKEVGHGTGLGVASAYGIIQSHGGVIEVSSKKGEGTTFVIYLPASDKEVSSETGKAEGIWRGEETILLVDDEEVILEVGRPLLERLGYKVLAAKSGRKALELYRDHGEEIDLVILDLIMPDLSGKETYVLLRNLDPKVNVLFSSGYAVEGKAAEILKQGCAGFIDKPFSLEQLSLKLREALERKPPAASGRGP